MTRIQVYTDPVMKRRIELAAARRDVSVTEYCLEAIRRRLEDEAVLDAETIEIPVRARHHDESLIADLQALRDQILAGRNGQELDIDRTMDEMRAERDDELINLP